MLVALGYRRERREGERERENEEGDNERVLDEGLIIFCLMDFFIIF